MGLKYLGVIKSMCEYVIKNARIIDGSGRPAFCGSVAVENGRIAKVGSELASAAVIDAEGRTLTPGFIDIHRHGDAAAFRRGFGRLELSQGLTTIVNGNCGMSAAPVDRGNKGLLNYLRPVLGDIPPEADTDTMAAYLGSLGKRQLPLNVGTLSGCGVIWSSVLSGEHPSDEEIKRFNRLLERELGFGALGVSLGLGYAPECFLTTRELIRGLAPLKNSSIPITFHMRQEGDGVCDAVREVIEIGEALNAHVHISHLKAMGRRNWGRRIPEALGLMAAARERGLNIGCDVYPYTAGSTQLMHILPPEFIEGGVGELIRRLKSTDERKKLRELIETGCDGFDNIAGMVGWDNIIMSTVSTEQNKRFEGMTVEAAAVERGEDPLDCVCDMLMEENGAITMIDFITCEEDIARILNSGFASVISDSIYPASGRPHPRLYGTYARIIQRFVLQRKDISLEAAVRAMTSLPAGVMGLPNKGLIAEGMDADINLFYPERIAETGSYGEPDKYAEGMDYMFVNGKPAIEQGKMAAKGSGRVIMR